MNVCSVNVGKLDCVRNRVDTYNIPVDICDEIDCGARPFLSEYQTLEIDLQIFGKHSN